MRRYWAAVPVDVSSCYVLFKASVEEQVSVELRVEARARHRARIDQQIDPDLAQQRISSSRLRVESPIVKIMVT